MIEKKKGFFESGAYVALVAVGALTAWATGYAAVLIGLFGILFLAIGATQTSTIGYFPLFATATFAVSDVAFVTEGITGLLVIGFAVSAAMVGTVINVIRNRRRPRLSLQTAGLVAMLIAALIGGTANGMAGSPNHLLGIAATGGMLAVYGMLAAGGMPYRPRYFAGTLVSVGVLLAAETLIYYLRQEDALQSMLRKSIDLGWGISNNIGLVVVLIMPLALYLASESRVPLVWYLVYALLALTVLFSFSRGSILAMIFLVVPSLCGSVRLAAKPRFAGASVLIVLAAGVAAAWVFADRLGEIFSEMIYGVGMDDNGRIELWKEGIRVFLDHNRWTGAGFGFGSSFEVDGAERFFRWYHNAPLQMLSNFGIVGLGCFAFHIATRYTAMFRKRSKFGLFVFWGALAGGMYGMIDVTYYTVYYLLPVVLTMVALDALNRHPEALSVDQRFDLI